MAARAHAMHWTVFAVALALVCTIWLPEFARNLENFAQSFQEGVETSGSFAQEVKDKQRVIFETLDRQTSPPDQGVPPQNAEEEKKEPVGNEASKNINL